MSRARTPGRRVLGRFDGEFTDGRQYSRHEATVAVAAVAGEADVYRLELAVEPAAAPERAVAAEVSVATLLTVRGALVEERGYARVSLSGSYREGSERTPGPVTLRARGPDRGPAELELSFDPAASTEKAVSVDVPTAPPLPADLSDGLPERVGDGG